MKKMLVLITVILLSFSLAMAVTASPQGKASPAKSATTLENLQFAYNSESNVKAKYEAFAKKADEEGYLMAGSLFRASAATLNIQIGKLAKAIKSMKAEPKATIQKPIVKSTIDNLKSTLNDYQTVKYVDFIKQAKSESNSAAVRGFMTLKQNNEFYAKYYMDASKNPKAWKKDKMDFYICPVCSYTVDKLTFKLCPVCATPQEKFIKVN